MPSAISRPKDPVDITSVSAAASRDPSFIIEPLPNARSICPSAASKARCLSIASLSKRRNAACIVPSPYSIPNDAAQRGPEAGIGTCFVRGVQHQVEASASSRGEHILHLACQLLQAKRLSQKLDTPIAIEASAESILGIPGNKDHPHFGMQLSHFSNELRPVYMRHNYVGDQKINRLSGVAYEPERVLAAFGVDNFVAFVAQGAGAKDPDRIVVFDEQDGTVPGQIRCWCVLPDLRPGRRRRIRRIAARQVYLENRTLARRAAHKNKTARLPD